MSAAGSAAGGLRIWLPAAKAGLGGSEILVLTPANQCRKVCIISPIKIDLKLSLFFFSILNSVPIDLRKKKILVFTVSRRVRWKRLSVERSTCWKRTKQGCLGGRMEHLAEGVDTKRSQELVRCRAGFKNSVEE